MRGVYPIKNKKISLWSKEILLQICHCVKPYVLWVSVGDRKNSRLLDTICRNIGVGDNCRLRLVGRVVVRRVMFGRFTTSVFNGINDTFQPLWDFGAHRLLFRKNFRGSQDLEITHAPHNRLKRLLCLLEPKLLRRIIQVEMAEEFNFRLIIDVLVIKLIRPSGSRCHDGRDVGVYFFPFITFLY